MYPFARSMGISIKRASIFLGFHDFKRDLIGLYPIHIISEFNVITGLDPRIGKAFFNPPPVSRILGYSWIVLIFSNLDKWFSICSGR